MTHRKIFAVTLAVVMTLVTTAVALAATMIVDHFNTGAQAFGVSIPAGGGTVSSGQSVTAVVIGGERDLVITATGAAIAENETYNARVLTGTIGRLSLSADPDVQGVAMITWDGSDGDPYNVNPTGLGGADLTDGGTNSGFHLVVLFDDLPVVANLRVYSSGANWSQTALNLPGQILSGNRVDFVIPFSSFTPGGGTGADFANVGAIVMTVDASLIAGADVILDLVELDAVEEYGDLPDTYGTTLASNGARHIILTGLRLGPNVDAETNGVPSTGADGDNLNQAPPDDEEGVVRPVTPKWTVGNPPANGGRVIITVRGCIAVVTDCFLYGWIDWNNNGSFADAGDQVIATSVIGDGTAAYNFAIPAGTTFADHFYARFRVCGGISGANDCATPTGASLTGEVEDYFWSFGPLAVTLESLQAQPTTSPVTPVILVGVSALALLSVVFLIRRRKTA